jgi:hypothetical protein
MDEANPFTEESRTSNVGERIRLVQFGPFPGTFIMPQC